MDSWTVGNYQSWSGLEHQDLWVGVPGRTSGTLQAHTKGLASMLGRYPEVLDITGQVLVRESLKFCIYVPKLGNKNAYVV